MCARGHTLVYKYTVSVQLYDQEVWLVWVDKLIFLGSLEGKTLGEIRKVLT